MSKWIPITERYPEDKQIVLITEFDTEFYDEEEKLHLPEETLVTIARFFIRNGVHIWQIHNLDDGIAWELEGESREPEDDYKVYVKAWMPLPEPYEEVE